MQQVFSEAYGIDLGDLDEGLKPWDREARMARLHQCLVTLGRQVETPQEGDVVLIRGWHIGVVIAPGEMLHSYRGGSATIERYTDPHWVNRIDGFYRYTP